MDFVKGAYGSELQRQNELINKIRVKVREWREGSYSGITRTSRDLLYYWRDENHENNLFFCQIEALETLIFITEVAEKAGEMWLPNELRKANNEATPGLFRRLFHHHSG